jgi:4-diphosphocytidyl-2C-methyl-D-erythritol kinase
VPLFLEDGPRLATGDGAELRPVDLPLDYHVLLVVPDAESKTSTGDVYREFDARRGERGYAERRAALDGSLPRLRKPPDLARLPRNDLRSSPLSERLEQLGAFRADVSGAGPAVYGLFEDDRAAAGARKAVDRLGRTWLTRPL